MHRIRHNPVSKHFSLIQSPDAAILDSSKLLSRIAFLLAFEDVTVDSKGVFSNRSVCVGSVCGLFVPGHDDSRDQRASLSLQSQIIR